MTLMMHPKVTLVLSITQGWRELKQAVVTGSIAQSSVQEVKSDLSLLVHIVIV